MTVKKLLEVLQKFSEDDHVLLVFEKWSNPKDRNNFEVDRATFPLTHCEWRNSEHCFLVYSAVQRLEK